MTNCAAGKESGFSPFVSDDSTALSVTDDVFSSTIPTSDKSNSRICHKWNFDKINLVSKS